MGGWRTTRPNSCPLAGRPAMCHCWIKAARLCAYMDSEQLGCRVTKTFAPARVLRRLVHGFGRAWHQTDLATAHQSSSRFPSQSVTDSGHGRKMRQTTGRQRLPGGVPTPGLAEFKLPQPQTGLGLDSSFCQARRPGPGNSTAAGQPGRTATSVQTSATGCGSDRSQGLPSDENLQGQESTARLTQV